MVARSEEPTGPRLNQVLRGMTATEARRSCRAYITAAATPISSKPTAIWAVADGAAVRPATATASNTARPMGKPRRTPPDLDDANANHARTITPAQTGTLTRKIQRQPNVSVM